MAIDKKMIFYIAGIILIILGLLTFMGMEGYLAGGLYTTGYVFYLFGFIRIATTTNSMLPFMLGIIIPIIIGIILILIPKVKKWQ